MGMGASTATSYPSQIKYIIGNEACERFSFYGMRSILVIFMTQHLLLKGHDAKAIYHLFVSACYFLPLLGGYLSDRFLGKYKTILYLSMVYCLGHGVLAMWETEAGMYWGLGLIALGAGGIKPCVSAHVGDQFTEKNKHMVQGVYDMFYFSVNFGSFFSTMLIPWILPKYGAGWAFGIPGILMAIATFVFWLGRNQYVHVPPTGKNGAAGFGAILMYSIANRSKRQPGESFFDVAKAKYSAQEVEDAKAAASVFKVFITVSAFWALFDQHSSSWVLQAEQMERTFLGVKFESSQLAALNPIMVMGLIPLFAYFIYPMLEKMGIRMTPLKRMSVGMVVAAASFVFVGLFQVALDKGQVVSAVWQVIPYLILTMAEVMVSISGLEFAYTQAPRSMKSTIMSFWQLTVFAGNFFTAYISKINVFEGSTFFFFFAALMLVLSVVFIIVANRYKVRDFIESHSSAPGAQPA